MIRNEYQLFFKEMLKGYSFDTFCTFTTSRPLSLQASRRMAEKFARDKLPNHTFFWASEPFDTRAGYHFHGLINTRLKPEYAKVFRADLFNFWTHERKYGRSQFVAINRKFGSGASAEEYCAKYCSKELADWDIYTSNSDKLAGRGTGSRPPEKDFIVPFKPYNDESIIN